MKNCSHCGKKTKDPLWTKNILGYEERLVCPICYERVMKNGYDSESEATYEDLSHAEEKRKQNY